jgi:hypothetical protein
VIGKEKLHFGALGISGNNQAYPKDKSSSGQSLSFPLWHASGISIATRVIATKTGGEHDPDPGLINPLVDAFLSA